MMSYDADNMLCLLLTIKNGGSASFITSHLSYQDTGLLAAEALHEGLIIETRKTFKITEKGIRYIEETNNELNRHGVDRNISIIPDIYIEKIPLDEIYFPKDTW